MADGDVSDVVTMAIDTERCLGVGQCELLEPEVFRVDDDDGLSKIIGTACFALARAEVLADRSPSGAISFAADRA